MLPGIKVGCMKSKGLVTKSLLLSAFWNKLRACLALPGGNIALERDTRQSLHLLALTLVALFLLLPAPLVYAEETGALLEQIHLRR